MRWCYSHHVCICIVSPYVEALTVVSSFGVGELSAINGLAGGMHFLHTIQSFSIPDTS